MTNVTEEAATEMIHGLRAKVKYLENYSLKRWDIFYSFSENELKSLIGINKEQFSILLDNLLAQKSTDLIVGSYLALSHLYTGLSICHLCERMHLSYGSLQSYIIQGRHLVHESFVPP